MSKLFKLKEWVTIPDAARHLSQIVNEPVCEADVLQMALDGHLKLTVGFPNGAKARLGRVMPYKDVPHRELPSLDGKATLTYADGYLLRDLKDGEELQDDTLFIHFDKEIVSIDGLWDLAMLGNERFDIEFDLQNLIGGPEVTMTNLEGTFLNRSDGTWAALQDRFKERTFVDIDGKKKTLKGCYYPAGGLGTDCTRVIRTYEILALQSRLDGKALDKPLANNERNTLLKLVIGMAIKGYNYDPAASKSTTPKEIADDLAGLGMTITDDTVRKYLKQSADTVLPKKQRQQ